MGKCNIYIILQNLFCELIESTKRHKMSKFVKNQDAAEYEDHTCQDKLMGWICCKAQPSQEDLNTSRTTGIDEYRSQFISLLTFLLLKIFYHYKNRNFQNCRNFIQNLNN